MDTLFVERYEAWESITRVSYFSGLFLCGPCGLSMIVHEVTSGRATECFSTGIM